MQQIFACYQTSALHWGENKSTGSIRPADSLPTPQDQEIRLLALGLMKPYLIGFLKRYDMNVVEMCQRCLMDASVSDFTHTGGGCNYCDDFLRGMDGFSGESRVGPFRGGLADLLGTVRRQGREKPYDCIVGVSGGVDSSWALVQAVEMGLRPLAVHMDNGWNSNLAVSNIYNIVSKLNVDLFTYVIDWNEYRELMLAFLAADVVDIELLYDNAAASVCYEQARKYGISAILSGSNTATESFRMHPDWSWRNKRDGKNIIAIAGEAGAAIQTFPLYTYKRFLADTFLRGIRWIPFLDFIKYDRETVLYRLEKDFGYRRYPYKHYENVFTRFYQGFLLPVKFGIDKRRAHLSALVCTGQLSRAEALKLLSEIAYPSQGELEEDRRYFLKKIGWDQEKLDEYIARPRREHFEWSHERVLPAVVSFLLPLRRALSKWSRRSLSRGRVA